jgi:hypothetical protein
MDRNLFVFSSAWLVATALLCTMMVSDLRDSAKLEASKPAFSFSVKGCAESLEGMATRGLSAEDRGPGLVISGNQVKYYRAINHLCCRKVVVGSELSGPQIDIYEEWGGEGCRCNCFSEIEATVDNLAPGRYVVSVYEMGTKPSEGGAMDKTLILTKELFINAG